MTAHPSMRPARRQVSLGIGQAGWPVGTLTHVLQGRREHSTVAYAESWLTHPERFAVSADLRLVPGHQPHKAASARDSVFHGAIADTAPDAWGRRVIARDHARRRRLDPTLPALTELDHLLAVDDRWGTHGRRCSAWHPGHLHAVRAAIGGAASLHSAQDRLAVTAKLSQGWPSMDFWTQCGPVYSPRAG